jgi:hypothetical protein
MFQAACNQGGQSGSYGAAAFSEVDKSSGAKRRSRGKHKLVSKDVLFEFACDKIRTLEKLDPNREVKLSDCARKILT